MLQKAERLIHKHFPQQTTFRPRSLLIVTWDDVGYYNQQYDKVSFGKMNEIKQSYVFVCGSGGGFLGGGWSSVTFDYLLSQRGNVG